MTESAIAEHLQQERTLPARTPQNYHPAYPVYTTRWGKNVTDLVMAVLGTQFSTRSNQADEARAKLLSFLEPDSTDISTRPSFSEVTSVTDARGHYNEAIIAYWPSITAYRQWAVESGFQQWWDALDAERESHGWFLEVFFPTMDRIETVYTNNEVGEGAAHMRDSFSGAIAEHGYWGSMRDRLPASQTNPLDGDKVDWNAKETEDSAGSAKRRIRVPGTPNLAVIRSAQDWADTSPAERELYLNEMHPVLVKGMDYIRDYGYETGCYSCRLMDVVDAKTAKADRDRTFGLAYFDELASLERWSREHPTHLAIFGGFFRYAKKLNNQITLRLSHEVLVLQPEQQLFEYVGCHAATGMLTSVYGHPGLAQIT
ncbi:phenylacetaldoxime dehydratase [Xylaria bambusicola]|uniref:phenylacetaldoxime dehydratase n=1 Tax=Xylaria bambusicola TaxID=326684 RepID=UPI00200778FC|nr:phenylacetaldoxime dehydratase [Xylaria bambusicola]KAI0514468.1 phenylacetaldoxime dehydratase [Xylaria bambusicola]